MKLNYTITGTLDVPESIYEETCVEDLGKSWSDLSTEEKIDYVKGVEEGIDYEGALDDAPDNGVVTLEVKL